MFRIGFISTPLLARKVTIASTVTQSVSAGCLRGRRVFDLYEHVTATGVTARDRIGSFDESDKRLHAPLVDHGSVVKQSAFDSSVR